MPKSMFQIFVCEPARSTRKWYTVPLSLIVHVALLTALIVTPLVATGVLPTPRSVFAFVTPAPPPSPPPSSPQPRPSEVARRLQALVDAPTVPLEPPSGIGRELALDFGLDPAVGVDTTAAVVEGVTPGGLIEAPPPAPPPIQPIRVGGQIKPPSRLKDVPPIYPAIAQAARVEGDVIIGATIGTNGTVENARVLRSAPLLDQAALDAVRMWVYLPTLLNGQPVPVIMTVIVRFRLK